MPELVGKRFFVTGPALGIGLVTAEEAIAERAHVVPNAEVEVEVSAKASDVAAFHPSDRASWVTGGASVHDGGLTVGLVSR